MEYWSGGHSIHSPPALHWCSIRPRSAWSPYINSAMTDCRPRRNIIILLQCRPRFSSRSFSFKTVWRPPFTHLISCGLVLFEISSAAKLIKTCDETDSRQFSGWQWSPPLPDVCVRVLCGLTREGERSPYLHNTLVICLNPLCCGSLPCQLHTSTVCQASPSPRSSDLRQTASSEYPVYTLHYNIEQFNICNFIPKKGGDFRQRLHKT